MAGEGEAYELFGLRVSHKNGLLAIFVHDEDIMDNLDLLGHALVPKLRFEAILANPGLQVALPEKVLWRYFFMGFKQLRVQGRTDLDEEKLV